MLLTEYQSGATVFLVCFFFFNDTATTEIYTLSLHDALPILGTGGFFVGRNAPFPAPVLNWKDRKSTRLNSSHLGISYAVFCLKKNKYKHRSWTACDRHMRLVFCAHIILLT